MKNHPVKFSLQAFPQCPGIVPNPVNTDIYLPFYRLTFGRQLEGDDVRIKVVLQELLVDLQKLFVGAKDIVEAGQYLLFLREYAGYKLFKRSPVPERSRRLEKEINL